MRIPYSGGGADNGNDSVIFGWRCANCVPATFASFDSNDALVLLFTIVPEAARGFRASLPSVAVAVDDFTPSVSFFLRGLEIFFGADVFVTLARFDFVGSPPPTLESVFPFCEVNIACGGMSDAENPFGFVGE